jgi:hypothetical protein
VITEIRRWALEGVAQSVVQGVVLRSDALFEPGSNVDFYRKCSIIFLISNRP